LRYFFRRRVPACARLLLVESGSRHLVERVIPPVRAMFGEPLEIDLVTCYPGKPAGIDGQVFNVNDYGGPAGRGRLRAGLLARGATVAGIICSAEPIMTKWKWWLGARLPVKIFIINENGDYFWFDWGHLGLIRRFAAYRAGLTGPSAVITLARLLFFPLTLAYLLVYAGTVHLRRRIRLL
jgi:hypothetical protein